MSKHRLPERIRRAVLKRDGHTCFYCGASGDTVLMTVDHIIPVSAGGTDDDGNLVACCSPCNTQKGATLLRELWHLPEVQAAMVDRMSHCCCPTCGTHLSDGATINDGRTKVVFCDFRLCTVGFSGVCLNGRQVIHFTPEQASDPEAQWVIRAGSRPGSRMAA